MVTRARPKPGRYYVVVTEADIACEAVSDRDTAQARASALEEKWGGPHRTVECVPMPRVRVGTVTISPGTNWFGVFVNGSRTSEAYKSRAAAAEQARDLRRALRGDAATKGGG